MERTMTSLKNPGIKITDNGFSVNIGFVRADANYSDITSMEYRPRMDLGNFIMGSRNSERYAGIFENKEFGRYQAVMHVKTPSLIVVKYGQEEVVAFNKDTKADTEQVYELLRAHLSP